MTFYFRFVSREEYHQMLQGKIINSPQFNYIHALKYHIENSENVAITIKQAVSFMVGTIDTDYLLVLKGVQVIGTGQGAYANYLTLKAPYELYEEWDDIYFTEQHLKSYSKENVVGVFSGDFYNWTDVARVN